MIRHARGPLSLIHLAKRIRSFSLAKWPWSDRPAISQPNKPSTVEEDDMTRQRLDEDTSQTPASSKRSIPLSCALWTRMDERARWSLAARRDMTT
mmetsp:Transcript_24019/g.58322  ORF Transcript_24019/g.58322 Transcript_24019/m.58322 type:complete len:95 (+) Transcript_24019:970-1254(+)